MRIWHWQLISRVWHPHARIHWRGRLGLRLDDLFFVCWLSLFTF